MPTIREALLPTINQLRDLPDQFGIRRYVTKIRRRSWSGGAPGAGTATVLTLTLDPVPKVRVVSTNEVAASGGTYEQGDYRIGPLTPRFVKNSVAGGYNPTQTMTTPGAPTVTPMGTTGATTWGYRIMAESANYMLISDAGTAGTTATGNATLSVTNFNRLTWSAVSGAARYHVYRTVGGATQGKIGTVAATTIDDTGLAGDGGAPIAPVLETLLLTTAPETDVCLLLVGDDGTKECILVNAAYDRAFRYMLTVRKIRDGVRG